MRSLRASLLSQLQNDTSVCSGYDLTLVNDGTNNCIDGANIDWNEEQVELSRCGSIAICKSEPAERIEMVPVTAGDPSTSSTDNVLSPAISGNGRENEVSEAFVLD